MATFSTYPTRHIVAVVVGAAYATILAIAGAQHARRAVADDRIGDFQAHGQGMTDVAALRAAGEADGIAIAARCKGTPFAAASISSPADRTEATVTGAVGVDALDTWTETAATVVRFAFVNVTTTDAVARQARRTGGTGEAAWQIDALGGAWCMRSGTALIHILGAGGCDAIATPASLTDAAIAKLVAALHTAAVSAQLPRAGCTTVRLALRAVQAMPAMGAQAAE